MLGAESGLGLEESNAYTDSFLYCILRKRNDTGPRFIKADRSKGTRGARVLAIGWVTRARIVNCMKEQQ